MPKPLNGKTIADIKILYNVPMRMRDGAVLYADVYRPNNETPYPAIVHRTPYLKDGYALITGYARILVLAGQGYNVVVQDVRGTGHSQGECDPAGHQDEDGYDTIEAVAAMPWCDGQIGMIGESYCGFSQLACARANPPHLKTICPAMTSWTKFPGIYDFGVFSPVLYGWIHGRAMDRERYYPGQYPQEALEAVAACGRNGDAQVSFRPMKDMPAGNIPGIPELRLHRELLENIDSKDYLASIGRVEGFEQTTVPTLNLTGWNDFLRDKTIYNYTQFRARGGSEACRTGSRLIVGPWPHTDQLNQVVEGIDYGPAASGDAANINGLLAQWYDYWLKGIQGPYLSEAPIKLFVMGPNTWRDEWEWPLARTQYTKMYLHSAGNANTLDGDGALSPAVPMEEAPDTYDYDPDNPCPTSAGDAAHYLTQDQRPNERRQDVLVYTTAPFAEPVELTGPIYAELYAATSAVDTDFVAKVSLVRPDGYARSLGMKLVRGRYRNGETAEPMVPGEIYKFRIEAANTSLVLAPGEAIRLDVTSSLFPDADPNMNTGGRVGYESQGVIAHQTIYHDAAHPSCLILPVIPE